MQDGIGYLNELSTYIPLDFVVGKELKEVFCVDMGQFFWCFQRG